MAEEQDQAQEQEQTEGQTADQDSKDQEAGKKKSKAVTWSIMGGIVLVFALAGFFLGKILVDTLQTDPMIETDVADTSQNQESLKDDLNDDDKNKTWFYKDLAPVVANLDEPGATRYIRVALTLEVYEKLAVKEGTPLIEEKTPLLRDWLTKYLASLSLDDARGEKNIRRVQADVVEAFNQILFPNGQPRIARVLLQEFAIQ